MPRIRQKSRMTFCSAAVSIQPVGLPGEARNIALVRWSQASNSLSRSRCQRPAFQSSSSRTSRGSAPTTLVAWKMLGQMGETITTLSPVSHTICSAVTTAIMAAPGTVMRSMGISAPTVRLWKARDGFAQGLDAAGVGVEGLAVFQRLGGGLADEGRGHQVGLAEPQRQHIGIAQAQRRHLGDAGGLQIKNGLADRVGASHGRVNITEIFPGA